MSGGYFIRRSKVIVCLLVVAVHGLAGYTQEPAGTDQLGINPEMVRAIMEAGRTEYDLPSLSVAVVFDTTIVFSEAIGYANLADSVPATPHTVYRVASITKPFTATALVKLAEEGTLRLDDPVSKYLPEYQVQLPFPGMQPTTLRQLAMHQSGLPHGSPYDFLKDVATHEWIVEGKSNQPPPERTRDEFLASLSDLKVEYRPWSAYGHYSNLGFRVLGLALERASGQPFDDYVMEHILKPLNMTRSGFDPDLLAGVTIATGYVYRDGDSEPLIAPLAKPGIAMYSGGLYATAEDLCRFLSLHFQTDQPGGKQIVSADGLRMMLWTAMDWKFTWDRHHPALEHGGGVPGYTGHVVVIPGLNLGIAVLTNSLNPLDGRNPTPPIAWEIIKRLKGDMAARVASTPDQEDSIPFENFVGSYVLGDDVATIEVSMRNDSLTYRLKDYEELESVLYRCAENTFCFKEELPSGYRVVFDQFMDARPMRLSIARYHFERVR